MLPCLLQHCYPTITTTQAYEWEVALAKARADKHDEIFQAVLRVRREAQERYHDRDGLTVAQRKKIEDQERLEEEEKEKKLKNKRALKRESEDMAREEDLAWELREEEQEQVFDRLRRIAVAKEEEQQENDRPLMEMEDERSAAREKEERFSR